MSRKIQDNEGIGPKCAEMPGQACITLTDQLLVRGGMAGRRIEDVE